MTLGRAGAFMRFTLILLMYGLAIGPAAAQQPDAHSYSPANGFVPDSAAADQSDRQRLEDVSMPACLALDAVGTPGQIADRASLEEFRTTWRHHNPLSAEQLAYAGRSTTVKEVGFYHGGDVLYQLDGIP